MASILLIVLLVFIYFLVDIALYFFTFNLGIFNGVGATMKVLYFLFCPFFLIGALIAALFQVKKDNKNKVNQPTESPTNFNPLEAVVSSTSNNDTNVIDAEVKEVESNSEEK